MVPVGAPVSSTVTRPGTRSSGSTRRARSCGAGAGTGRGPRARARPGPGTRRGRRGASRRASPRRCRRTRPARGRGAAPAGRPRSWRPRPCPTSRCRAPRLRGRARDAFLPPMPRSPPSRCRLPSRVSGCHVRDRGANADAGQRSTLRIRSRLVAGPGGRIDADVCVVGAGYAGLTAARRLSQAGNTVVVLEARDRVGGRIWTQQLADGTPVDRGGAWLAPYHDAIFALAAEVGVIDLQDLREGRAPARRRRPHPAATPGSSRRSARSRCSSIALGADEARPDGEAGPARRAVDREARRGVGPAHGRRLRRALAASARASGATSSRWRCAACSPATSNDVSFLHLLFLVRAHGSINTPVLDREGRAGEPGRRRRRFDRATRWPTSSATRCA